MSRINAVSPEPVLPSDGIEPEAEISLVEIFDMLLKGKWLILAAFFLVVGITALYTFTVAPEYQAESLLLIDDGSSGPQLSEALGLELGSSNVANEVEVIRSRKIRLAVADVLIAMQQVPGSSEQLSILQTEEERPLTTLEVAERLENYITVSPLGRDVDLIRVLAVSTMPEEASFIATTVAKEFEEYNRNTSRERMEAAREQLENIVADFREEFSAAENDLVNFLDRQQVIAPGQEAGVLLSQIQDLNQQLYSTQTELVMARAEKAGIEQQLEELIPELSRSIANGDMLTIEQLQKQIAERIAKLNAKYAANPELRTNPSLDRETSQLIQEINRLETDVAQLSDRFVEELFESNRIDVMAGQGSQLDIIKELRRNIVTETISISSLQASQDVLEGELDKLQGRLAQVPEKELVLQRLQEDREFKREILLQFATSFQEAQIAEQSELGYVRIIDEAIVPRDPVRPRKALNLAMGGMLGILLGIALAIGRSTFDNRIQRPEDLRKRGYTVMGVVPNLEKVIKADFQGKETVSIDGRSYSTTLISLLNPLSPASESFRRLRTNLQFSRPDKPVQTILVTSSGPGEGKTSMSSNLAVIMAQSGRRTLYIDADLRRSTAHKVLGVPREPGLVDVLFNPTQIDWGTYESSIEDLYLLPSGKSVPNPAEILGSRKMRDFLVRIRQEFDIIVLDSPPVLAVTDALLLAPYCDANVLVCSAKKTVWHSLQGSRDALLSVGVQPSGVVLNRFDPKEAYGSYGYGYGYGYGYYDYYGEKKDA
ncbi:MAG: polysaccharide biosynthesis tyrosine autokinase [Rhodothermales bacterium]